MGEVIAMCWKDVLKRDGCGCKTQKQDVGEEFEKTKIECPRCKGKKGGCKHCNFRGFHKQPKSRSRNAFTARD